jgi:hypothetical protein
MSILDGTLTLTIERAWQIQEEQVQHYSQLLETDTQRAAFLAAVERLNAGRTIDSGWDVPRGVEIERLYYRAKGLTDADHDAFCASLD